jgi:hypothetical protein
LVLQLYGTTSKQLVEEHVIFVEIDLPLCHLPIS